MSFSPISILKDSQKSVPAVKYAAGIAGVAAVVAIIAGFELDYRIAVFGIIIVLGLMFVLMIFGYFAAHSGAYIMIMSLFAAWSFLLLTVAASLFLMTSYFFSWPRSIDAYIKIDQDVPIEIDLSVPQTFSASGYVTFTSEQGDYIGQGKKYEFSNQNGLFTITGNLNAISVYFEGDSHWNFDFAAPREKSLEVGHYSSAQRAAFHNPVKPGIDIFGDGRGCNEISGEFTIKEIIFSSEKVPERFVAVFEQHCEGESPKLKGVIDITVNTITPVE